jgi:hypothetical protein
MTVLLCYTSIAIAEMLRSAEIDRFSTAWLGRLSQPPRQRLLGPSLLLISLFVLIIATNEATIGT